MKINQSHSKLRSFRQPLQSVEVVTPEGRIKTIHFDNHVQSPILNLQSLPGGQWDVQVSATYREAGWVLLSDLYQAEDRMDDFEAREDYRAAARSGNLGRENFEAEVFHQEKGTRKITYDVAQRFPDELLPAEVLKRRQVGGKNGRKWEPPKKSKGKKQPQANA